MEENHKENKNIIHKTSIKNRQILNKSHKQFQKITYKSKIIKKS